MSEMEKDMSQKDMTPENMAEEEYCPPPEGEENQVQPEAGAEGEAGGEADESQEVSGLLSRLEELNKEKEELFQNYLRLRADFENYRRRTREELSQAREKATEDVVLKILPVLDNLERAVNSYGDAEKWREGVQMVLRQFQELLAGEGVAPIQAVGEIFDPQRHEAVAREIVLDQPENVIIDELQKGYLFKDKTLRPSLVKVAAREEQAGKE